VSLARANELPFAELSGNFMASHALGHADLTTTLGIYGHWDDSDMESAMESYAQWITTQEAAE
jgi:integrase